MKDTYFIHRLESVRGLAALMVSGGHALMLFPTDGIERMLTQGLGCVANGWAAVTMFFVLSGYVLGLAVRRAEGSFVGEFIRYSIRRVFRIYPAFLFTTLLILAGVYGMGALSGGTPVWFNRTSLDYHPNVLNSEVPLTAVLVIRNLFLLDSTLNLVTWTLKVEIGCSLLLPLFHLLVRRWTLMGKVLVLVGLIWLACLGKWMLLLGQVEWEAAFDGMMLKYAFLFYLGYLLPELQSPIFAVLKRRSLTALVMAVAVAVFLCAGRISFGEFQDDLRIVQGLAAAVILGGLLYGAPLSMFKVLDLPVVRFYGRISYSFYLLHDLNLIIISRTVVHLAPAPVWSAVPLLSAGVLWAVSVAGATVLAWLSFSYLEKPFVQYSRELCIRLPVRRHLVPSRA